MANFNFRLGGANDPFRMVFGEDGSKSVIRYLDERVNYIIGPGTSVGELIRNAQGSTLPDSSAPFALSDFPAHVNHAENQTAVKAENIGLNLWLMQEAARPLLLSFHLDGASIPITSPRIGLFRLYPHYLTDFFIENIAILIHEARHSDCTGGLDARALEALKSGDLSQPGACGHRHSICKTGDYIGLPACDDHPWGAYAIQAVWLNAVANQCRNCRRSDEIMARALLLDASSRISRYSALIRGQMGPPDMSSEGSTGDRIRDSLRALRARRIRALEGGPTP
jgi:hypothetical protein